MLQITQRRQEGTLIAVYTGELDHHAARAAIEQTEDLLVLFPCEKLVLDLSELTFMDSSGLAVVLHLYRTCARSGRRSARLSRSWTQRWRSLATSKPWSPRR